MKKLKFIVFAAFITNTTALIAQDTIVVESTAKVELLNKMPKNAKEYPATEKNFIASVDWIEITAIGTESEKRKIQYANIVTWLIGSPNVTVSLNSTATPFMKKNPELLIVFMGGYGKYVLQNPNSKDEVKKCLAGIQSAIKVYNLGGVKKDKAMLKLIEKENAGTLEKWITDALTAG